MTKKNDRIAKTPLTEVTSQGQQHEHAKNEKECCGDCNGQGSCKKLINISQIPQTSIDIAHLK